MENLYILRHSNAEDLNENHKNGDFDRRLTEEGIKKTKRISSLFNKGKILLDCVLTSPYLRAKETAEHFVANLDTKPPLKEVDFLSAGASVKEISMGLISEYMKENNVLIVGHAPDLEIFLGKLVGAQNIKLKKGAIGKVVLNNSVELYGELEWLVTPKLTKCFK